MSRKKLTQQEVERYCLKRDYKVLSPYKGSLTKITLQNIKTSEIGEMTFNHFKQGKRFDTITTLTQQEVEEFCEPQGYKVLSKYVNNKIKITLQNIKTDEIGEMRFSNFQQGQRFDTPRNHRKFTQQEVELYCESQGYKVLSEYVNSSTKIELQNIKTGEIGEMIFSSFRQGKRFDIKKGRKTLTQQEVEEYCLERGYKVLSEYVNSRIKIKLQNIKTGEIGEMLFRNFKQGQRFDNPKATKKLTQQEVESHCLEHGYRVLSSYVNKKTKITLQNIETGEIGEMKFSSFKKGSRFDTKKGSRFDTKKGRKKFTQQEVEEYCLEHGYRVLSKYIDCKTKIKLQNIKTNIIGEMIFDSFKRGVRFDNKKATKKITYKEYIQPFTDEDYTVLINEKDYKDVTTETKINVMCPNNHQWSVKRSNFTSSQNQRCPMCNQDTGGMSLGEKLVYQVLQGNHITFEREKRVYIDDNRYSFDFYFEIKEFGYTDKFIIEYDGIQHYREGSGYFSGGLKKRQASDEIKDKYAYENNIQMIRIPWLNNTIDKVLFVINGETGLNLQKVQVYLPTIQEIADYYLTHSIKETMDEFSIGNGTARNYFKQIHGVSKTEYLGAPRATNILKQEIADYHLTHTSKETGDRFNISRHILSEYFKQIYGMTKTDYIGTSKQEEIADYYLSHGAQETVNKFNINIRIVTAYFKQIYGVNKTEYTGTSKQKISDYYLTHSSKDTMDEFNLSSTTINKYFKQIHGTTKIEYLKMIDTTK